MTDPVGYMLSLFMLLIIADRMNPFTAMDEDEFVDRFRLRKTTMFDLIEEIREHLPAPHDSRGNYFLQ